MGYECACEQCRGVAAPASIDICDCGEEVDEGSYTLCHVCEKSGCDSCIPEDEGGLCLKCQEARDGTV